MVEKEYPRETELRQYRISGCEAPASFTCRDCTWAGLCCLACIVSIHQEHPCHRPHHWNGEYWERTSLDALGFVWYLGHGGQSCPHLNNDSGPQRMTLADINGIHTVTVGTCRCDKAPDLFKQLLNCEILPASMERPRTAFTFRLMRHFHLLNLISHITPWDLSSALHRMSDNINPTCIPVDSPFITVLMLI
jgi:hypothetical protein